MTDKYEEIQNDAELAKENNEKQEKDDNNEGLEQTKEDVQKTLE
ncbi:hypothetical protein [Macrococcus animalis]